MTGMIHRQEHCRWCGQPLDHQPTGRPKEFCNASCRVAYNRARKNYVRACVEAALAGEPEPERDFGYPISITTYIVEGDTVTKRDRSAEMREVDKLRQAGEEFLEPVTKPDRSEEGRR